MISLLRKTSLLLLLLLLIIGFSKADAQSPTTFHEGMLRTVKTHGWLKELQQRQHDGDERIFGIREVLMIRLRRL
ncbi:MAG: hypothetical protein J6M19_00735 [Bacteroidaceae bacterium]|nr:hypothetical protein [Bacteroidaceae bacterium]